MSTRQTIRTLEFMGLMILGTLTGATLIGCGTDYDERAYSGWDSIPEEPAPSVAEPARVEVAEAIDVAEVAAPIEPTAEGIPVAIAETIEPAADPHQAFLDAEDLYHRGDRAGAIPLLRASIAGRPDFVHAHYLLGLAYRKTEQPERAETAFRDALDLDPGHHRARVNLARVLIDLDVPADALEVLAESGGDTSESGDLWNVRGLALMELDRTMEAEEAFLRATQLDPENVWAWNNAGLIRIRSGRFEEALTVLEMAAALPDAPAYVFNNLGVARERTGELLGAESAYAQAETSGHATAGSSRERVGAALAYLAARGGAPDSLVAQQPPSPEEVEPIEVAEAIETEEVIEP